MAAEAKILIRKVLVIYNPRSGTLLAADDGNPDTHEDDPERILQTLFQERGIEAELHAFDADALPGLVDRACAGEMDALVVCGGDGSIRSVVTVLGDRTLALGIIPGGTMNIVARDAGLPTELADAVDVIVRGRISPIDVACVNGEPFLCNSALGLMPHLARTREELRGEPWWRKWPKVLAEFFSLLKTYPRLRLTVEANGETRRFRTRAVAVSNNLLTDAAGPIPARESVRAGKLGIYVAQDTSRWALLRIALRMASGSWQGHRSMETIETEAAVLSLGHSGLVSVMNDGEPTRMRDPLRYTIRAGALRLLVPEASGA